MAGPIADEPGADETGKQVRSAGMMSCRANAMAAATAWTEADPLHLTAVFVNGWSTKATCSSA